MIQIHIFSVSGAMSIRGTGRVGLIEAHEFYSRNLSFLLKVNFGLIIFRG